MKRYVPSLLLLLVSCLQGFAQTATKLEGAWTGTDNTSASVLLTIVDGYLMQTTYTPDKFIATRGGTWQRDGTGNLVLMVEFDSQDSSRVGQVERYPVIITGGRLTITGTAGKQALNRMTESSAQSSLTGLWRITGRVNEQGERTTMQAGPRKTIKLLTGSRFQWAAINPKTKQFMGTGGGTYQVNGNQYTETIDFFSRDNSRVGRSLTFTVNLTGTDWQHTGKSSTGGAVNEVWSREK